MGFGKACLPQHGPGANHNVRLTVLLCAVWGTAESIWTGTALAAFLYILSHDKNLQVGIVEAAYGISILVVALPVGYLADRFPRGRIIRSGSIVILLAAAFTLWSVCGAVRDSDAMYIHILIAAMCLWGVSAAVIDGPAQALYADCVPTGQRSTWYVVLFAAYILSSCAGPLVSIAVFAIDNDQWSLVMLRNVILVGIALECVAAGLMLFYDDSKTLDEETEQQPLITPTSGVAEALSTSLVPYLLFTSDVIISLGSGMTTKFFPLYFKNTAHFTPIQVQSIYVAVPLSIVLCSIVVQQATAHKGRLPVMLAVKAVGIGLLFAMAFAASSLGHIGTVSVYVVRTGLMNSTYPVQESILMDHVPKSTRARWKSLDSISKFGWCGSALLGGYLGDRFGYSFTFAITGGIQLLGSLCLLPLLPLVQHESQTVTL